MYMRISLDSVSVYPTNVVYHSLLLLRIVYIMFILVHAEREYMVHLEHEHSHACAMRACEYIDVCTVYKRIRTVGLMQTLSVHVFLFQTIHVLVLWPLPWIERSAT